ncbi:MAG: class II aldolase/adducin family protein [Victivallales bacterium]|nr:class II aldolase/adducin family protein [Victivallales bacterium]
MELINILTELTRKFGSADYVKGGGGNSSAKNADTIWVKPSGSTMGTITADKFVELDRAAVNKMNDIPLAGDTKARENTAKSIMAAAVKPHSNGRPSVEAPLHNLFNAVYVIHTHPVLVNGMTCARDGQAACARLFPDALWVDYIDPGLTLYRKVRERVFDYEREHGRQPEVVFLKNHGVFVAGDTPEKIAEIYADIFAELSKAYAAAGISPTLAETAMKLNPADFEVLSKAVPADLMQGLIVAKAFSVADGPISPDHIVYMKSFVHKGEITEKSIAAFKQEHGYYPVIMAKPEAIYALGANANAAFLAWELARDGALVKQLAAAFGGIVYLDNASRNFIENWEVESYRRKQLA